MQDFNFVRIASVSPKMNVAAVAFNTGEIINATRNTLKSGCRFFLFPELSLSGYSCADLFFQEALHKSIMLSLRELCDFSAEESISLVVGAPIRSDSKMFNCAVFISNGEIIGIVPKTFIPNSDEYYEERWFSGEEDRTSDFVNIDGEQIPFGADLVFTARNYPNLQIGIEICEDLWSVVPPSSELALSGCNVLLNLSASSEYLGKANYRKNLVISQSARCNAAYVYSSAGANESSTDFVVSGHCLIAENGTLLAEGKRFSFDNEIIIADIDIEKLNSERIKNTSFAHGKSSKDFREVEFDFSTTNNSDLLRTYSPTPFVPKDLQGREAVSEEILAIQSTALAKRLKHIACRSVVIGISGGLDSTLALIACVRTFEKLGLDKKDIISVSMPGLGTSDRTKSNAALLAEYLGTTFMEIKIDSSVLAHFDVIGHDKEAHDIVYENTQARMRTMILMNLANKYNAIVIGTGDLSEVALGWSTYNGDHISMYSVNSGVPKTLVRHIIYWASRELFSQNVSDVLKDILDTPISPELLPADADGNISQETEKLIGPYELHDFYLYHFVRFGFSPTKIKYIATKAFESVYTEEEIEKWLIYFLKRFFRNQYKRSCVPDGIKVGTVALSPRGDWRMPSDADYSDWISDLVTIGDIQ